MQKSDSRILTTHTGSLPRPKELTELYIRLQKGGNVDQAALTAAGRDAVRRVVPKQAAAGIDVGNDGEQTREGFFIYLSRRVTGMGGGWNRPPRADVERYPEFKRMREEYVAAKKTVTARDLVPKVVSEVKYISADAIEAECRDFAAALRENNAPFSEAFMTAPSPGIVAKALLNEYYETEEAYLQALGRALRVEYETIVKSGFVLQIDAPDLGLERHITYAKEPLNKFLMFVERVVVTINKALETVPRDRVRLHVCWGNYEGPHDCDVPLKEILPIILQAKVGGLVLPFANPRHAHEYRYLKEIPLRDDQLVVAGVIDTLTNVVEHPETIADRIVRVAEVIGDPTRVLAGTDCGFDTSAGAGRVAEDVVWAKLASLSDGARIASARLFGK